jgi:hypothetical protein
MTLTQRNCQNVCIQCTGMVPVKMTFVKCCTVVIRTGYDTVPVYGSNLQVYDCNLMHFVAYGTWYRCL